MSYEWMKSSMDDVHAVLSTHPSSPWRQRTNLSACSIMSRRHSMHGAIFIRRIKARMVENLRAVLSRRAFTTPEIHVVRGVIPSTVSRGGGREPRQSQRRVMRMLIQMVKPAPNELKPILVFDPGIGGLTVLREARL